MNKLTKRKKQTAIAGALLLAMTLTLSACGGENNAGGADTNAEQNNSGAAAGNQLPEDSGIMDPDAPASGENSNSAPDSSANENANNEEETPANDVLSAEGVYTGQIDSHSIEITTDAGATVYQVPEELLTVIENLPADAKVKFEYTEKSEGDSEYKQNWLTKIEAVQ
ncbi:hypothetical protein D3P08_12105 [Paenibacillus nanensis]|uniref:DUF3221 domain-containing protein n=1 Tax=Paenibacillus nanensis TaxID=393251 RepID=A0A3A1UW49_9BACL|nr:hypothetical protein [Paenibacillus nanensis]RIX52748.1 hypothetical protein D3P08_12105 [Paenibacillus nanensis]